MARETEKEERKLIRKKAIEKYYRKERLILRDYEYLLKRLKIVRWNDYLEYGPVD